MSKTAIAVVVSYVAGGWTTIELSQFVLERYFVSNVWIDILVMLFLAMSPTAVVLAFFHDRKKLRKVLIPSNVLLSLTLAIILFIGKPLGTYARTVDIVNEKGETENVAGMKENFRIKIGIADFHNVANIDSLDWMKIGFSVLLAEDLEYSDVISSPPTGIPPNGLRSEDGINKFLQDPVAQDLDYVILGSFTSSDLGYTCNYTLYKSTGTAIYVDTVHADNIFYAVDEISERIISQVDIPEGLPELKNVPIASITTASSKALESYINFFRGYSIIYLNKALETDSAFVHARMFYCAMISTRGDEGLERATEIMEKGLLHIKKLKRPGQLDYLLMYYKFKDKNRAYDLAKKIVQLYPNNYYKSAPAALILQSNNEYFSEFKNYIINIYDQLDYEEKISWLLNCAYQADVDLMYLIDQEIDNDPFNLDWINLKVINLYAKKEILSAKRVLTDVLLFEPKKEDSINMVIDAIDNYDLVDLSGDYISSWGYVRRFVKNKLGIPVVIFSNVNNQSPFLILDKYRIVIGMIGDDVPQQIDSILYDQNDNIYGIKIFNATITMLKYDEKIAELEQNIAAGNYTLAKESIEILVGKFPKHFFLKAYQKHIDFVLSITPIDFSIIGTYQDNWIVAVQENGNMQMTDPYDNTIHLMAIEPTKFALRGNYGMQVEFTKQDSVIFLQIWDFDYQNNKFTSREKKTMISRQALQ